MTAIQSKTILPTLVCLASACLWVLPAGAESLVSNGTFDNGSYSPWWTYAATGAAQTVAVTDGRLCSTMVTDTAGTNLWDVIIGLSGLNLKNGQYYHISFSASADAARTIRFKSGFGDTPYTDYFVKSIALTSTAQVFDYTYLNLRDDAAAQFQFQIGGSAGTVCLDDIVFDSVDAPAVPDFVTQSNTGHPLKYYSSVVKMGTAVDTPTFLSSPVHNSILTGEFSMMTPANSMKMNLIQPTQGVFDYTDTDALLDFAEKNGLEFRGHPLVWHTQTPSWFTSGTFDRDAMIGVMYDHIDGLVKHYGSRIMTWDVVNEAIDLDQGDSATGLRHTPWYDTIGADFIDLAFQHAHEANPDAKLLYNDYNIEQMGDAKADRAYDLVNDMVQRGIPINAIGFQSHYYVTPDGGTSGIPDISKIRDNMDRFAQIGVEVQITECDFRIGKPLSDDKLQNQADFYGALLQACIDAPNCSRFTVWGLSDFDSWVPSTFKDYDYAHLFDAQFIAKPGYQAMVNVFDRNSNGTGGASGAGGSSGTGGSSTDSSGTGGSGNTGGSSSKPRGSGGVSTAGSSGSGGSSSGEHASSADSAKSSSSSGCSVRSSNTGAAPSYVGVFALLGLAFLFRRRG